MSEAQTSASEATTAGAATAKFAGGADRGSAGNQQTQELAPEQDHARYRQLRDKLQEELNQRAETISVDTELDEGTRHRSLNELWNKYSEGERMISQLYEKELQGIVDEQEQKVFRIPSNLMDSVRGAYQLVNNEVDLAGYEGGEGVEGIRAGNEKLEAMYERAVRTRDRALQLACFQYATEKGLHDLRDRHLATSKDLSRAWESYTAARQKQDNWDNPQERLWQHLTGNRGLVKPATIR